MTDRAPSRLPGSITPRRRPKTKATSADGGSSRKNYRGCWRSARSRTTPIAFIHICSSARCWAIGVIGPFNAPFWESPDISITPVIRRARLHSSCPSHGGTVLAGTGKYALCTRVEPGLCAAGGGAGRVLWFNPSLAIDGTNAHFVGVARCELAGRGLPGSHKLVKCPTTWVPVLKMVGTSVWWCGFRGWAIRSATMNGTHG